VNVRDVDGPAPVGSLRLAALSLHPRTASDLSLMKEPSLSAVIYDPRPVD
jgi:hypothetical protein